MNFMIRHAHNLHHDIPMQNDLVQAMAQEHCDAPNLEIKKQML